jgi:hypothetical protein
LKEQPATNAELHALVKNWTRLELDGDVLRRILGHYVN